MEVKEVKEVEGKKGKKGKKVESRGCVSIKKRAREEVKNEEQKLELRDGKKEKNKVT